MLKVKNVMRGGVLGVSSWWLLVILAGAADGFKSGAPASMCAEMMPQHEGAAAQNGPHGFRLTASPLDPAAGLFKVKLEATRDPMAGFLLEARPAHQQSAAPLGTFSKHSEDAKTVNCPNGPKSALTHANNTRREMIESEWQSPADYEGDVIFIATVVANYSTFWKGVVSPSVQLVKRSADKGSLPHMKFQNLYDGCGVQKRCLGDTDECVLNRDCISLVTVAESGEQYLFEMFALKSKYVAVGLSEDNKMGADNVVECVHEENAPSMIKAYRSWNVPNMKQNKRLEDEQTGFVLKEGTYTDGDVFCKVLMDSKTEVEGLAFNLEKNSYHLLLAAGDSLKDESVGFHNVAYRASADKQLLREKKEKKPHDPIFDGCDVEKNCFGFPDGCIQTETCNAIATILVQGTNYIFELKGKADGYVALGFSRDDKMGGDSVVDCVHEQGNKVSLYRSWNKPGQKANTRRKINQDTVNLMNSSYVDGIIYCKFSHSMRTTIENEVFDFSKDKYFLLLAAGSGLKDNSVGFHDILYTSTAQDRLLSDVGTFSAASKLLLRLHGAFMITAWIGCASIGIILARYFKQTWVGSSLCAKDLWFAWHRFFMFLTWALTIAGFVLIFVELGEWVGPKSQIHAILGCVTTLLCFVQPIAAAFRPHPTARNRPVFNWMHWFIGNTAHLFAIVTIFFAVPLNKAELPDWLDWVLVAYVVIYVTMHLLFSFAGCIGDRKNGKRVNSFPMKDITTSRNALNSIERKQDAPFTGFRKCLLSLHIIAVSVITASVVVIIVLAPIKDQWESLQSKFKST